MNPIQREALAVLAELCDLSDDIRIGQLISFMTELTDDQFDQSLAEIEDDQLLAAMQRHRENLRTYRSGSGVVAPAVAMPQGASLPTNSPG